MTEIATRVDTSLEAHPAALVVQTACKYASRISLRVENKTVNAKSIMGMINLGIVEGQNMTIQADGPDEEAAVKDLRRFFSAR
ncbi:MAG: HPr family phosphocarrier protein [Clostridiales bacterium]|jgi:phosphotransferase system HPr (HPr) family protein|nr:HPr family phosphocarrier protein [Clostridiales bacterium]